MCGIIGYVGHRRAPDVLLAGLGWLEYRGYDSAGLAWFDDGQIKTVRTVGNLSVLRAALAGRVNLPPRLRISDRALAELETATTATATNGAANGAATAVATATVTATAPPALELGIGHTRWATHGGVTEQNAHPHSDASGRISIVLNGIIENYLALRRELGEQGIQCRSETDAEVVAHLIAVHYHGDLAEAVQCSLATLQGQYAFVAMCADEPDVLVGTRRDCPLLVGVGDGEQFIASSMAAFLGEATKVVFLEDGEVAVLRDRGTTIIGVDGRPYRPCTADAAGLAEARSEKCGFETFMLKEIHEQPDAIARTLSATEARVPQTATARSRTWSWAR